MFKPFRAGSRILFFGVEDERVCLRHPNPHVTFGRGGPHFCLGSFLASLEIRILLEEILARNVRFELAGPPVRLSSNFINGFKSLPVRVVDVR